MNTIAEEFEQMLRDIATETGKDLATDLKVVREYASQHMKLLARALLRRDTGYSKALIGSRNAVAVLAGIEVVETADAADQRLLGAIHAALGMGARFLAGVI